jgi:hypothetical protein
MKRATKLAALAAGVTLASAGLLVWNERRSHAADHLDPPMRTNPDSGGMDRNADIADIYAWHQGEGANRALVTALTFSGPNNAAANQAVACDRDVLYTIHIDNTGDGMPEHNIRVRFGRDDRMNCFARFEGVPGLSAPVVTRTESVRNTGGVRLFAGLRDDPFFFDLVGFRETLAMGMPRFVNDRDFFARKNSSAIVVEVPLAAALGAGTTLRVWATTGRFGT